MEISKIRMDGGTQPRSELDYELIAEFSESINNGAKFPPIIVFYDGSEYWLADGFHRVEAFKRSKKTEIEEETVQGTKRDAVLYSVGANAEHGKRRSNEDKRRAVMTLLNDDEWSLWSNSEIARRCNVSKMTVGRQREELTVTSYSEKAEEPKKFKNKHGQESTMKTENIGKKPVTNQPKTQQKHTPEEKEAIKNGVIYDAKMFITIAKKQIDRIEVGDSTAIESLMDLINYIKKEIKKRGEHV